MKKLITLILFAVTATAFNASAQIQRGNVLVGSEFGKINLGLDDSKQFNLDITPKAAWFIQDNVALGGYVNLDIASAKGSNTTTNYGIGALGRYYGGGDVPVLRHGRIFGEATVGLGGINVSDGGGHTNGLDFSAGPGFAYFVTPSLGLETLLKYNGTTGFGDAGYQSRLALTFGFQVYLPGRATAAKVRGDVRK